MKKTNVGFPAFFHLIFWFAVLMLCTLFSAINGGVALAQDVAVRRPATTAAMVPLRDGVIAIPQDTRRAWVGTASGTNVPLMTVPVKNASGTVLSSAPGSLKFAGGAVPTVSGDDVTITTPAGTLTSVALTVPGTIYNVTGSPLTGSGGTLALTMLTQTANTLLMGPVSGSAAAPTFRTLTAADFPTDRATAALNKYHIVYDYAQYQMGNAGNTLSATTTNFQTYSGSFNIPESRLSDSVVMIYKGSVKGVYSTGAALNPALIASIRFMSQTSSAYVLSSGSVSNPTGATNREYHIHYVIVTRPTGTAKTVSITSYAELDFDQGTAGNFRFTPATTTGTFTWTSTGIQVQAGVAYASTAAGNSVVLQSWEETSGAAPSGTETVPTP